MGSACSSPEQKLVYKQGEKQDSKLLSVNPVNSAELIEKLVMLITTGKELEDEFYEMDAALHRVDVLLEERPLLVSKRLLEFLSSDAIDLSIVIKERMAAMLIRYLCAFVSPKGTDGPSGPPAIPEADQIKLEAQISTQLTWCRHNEDTMPTTRLHYFIERAQLLVDLIKSTRDRTDLVVNAAKSVATMSIASTAGAIAKAASVIAIDKFKEMLGERHRPLVVRLFEVDLLRVAMLQSDTETKEEESKRKSSGIAQDSKRRKLLESCVENAIAGIDAHDDWLEACALIEVLFEAGRRTHPQSSLRAKITSTLQRLTQFETPWWKLSRYDTDWRIRAAAQRSIIILHLVDTPDAQLELTGDGENRTAQFFVWATASDNESQRAQRFSSELLRWHPRLPQTLDAAASQPSSVTEEYVTHEEVKTLTKKLSLIIPPRSAALR